MIVDLLGNISGALTMMPDRIPSFCAMRGVVMPCPSLPKPEPSFQPIFSIIFCARVIPLSFTGAGGFWGSGVLSALSGSTSLDAAKSLDAAGSTLPNLTVARRANASSPVTFRELLSGAVPAAFCAVRLSSSSSRRCRSSSTLWRSLVLAACSVATRLALARTTSS